MLPACEGCNWKKGKKTLEDFIAFDKYTNLYTAAQYVPHLNSAARKSVVNALRIKHEREALCADEDIASSTIDLCSPSKAFFGNSSGLSIYYEEDLSALSEIDKDKLQRIDQLTELHNDAPIEGSNGEVLHFKFKREGKDNNIFVGVKKPIIGIEGHTLMTARELKVLNNLKPHRNIVKYYGWFQYPEGGHNQLGLIFEWMPFTLSSNKPSRDVDPVSVFLQISRALKHLHGCGIYHRDIKANNILVRAKVPGDYSKVTAKLCDFGCAKIILKDQMKMKNNTRDVGNTNHRAPEVKRCIFDSKSDVYSLGMTMEYIRERKNNAILEINEALRVAWESLERSMRAIKSSERCQLDSVIANLKRFSKDNYTVSIDTGVGQKLTGPEGRKTAYLPSGSKTGSKDGMLKQTYHFANCLHMEGSVDVGVTKKLEGLNKKKRAKKGSLAQTEKATVIGVVQAPNLPSTIPSSTSSTDDVASVTYALSKAGLEESNSKGSSTAPAAKVTGKTVQASTKSLPIPPMYIPIPAPGDDDKDMNGGESVGLRVEEPPSDTQMKGDQRQRKLAYNKVYNAIYRLKNPRVGH